MSRSSRVVSLFALVALLSVSVGCKQWQWVSPSSFAAGWLAHTLLPTQTSSECYLNGVLIDCSELPETAN